MKLNSGDTIKTIDDNTKKSKQWMNRYYYLRAIDDSLDALTGKINFVEAPPLNIILGFAKSTLRIGMGACQWNARRFDPRNANLNKVTQGVNFLNALGFITSTLGLTALALGGAATGAALAPVSLFVYASINAANEIAELGKSAYEWLRQVRRREPKETYQLRVGKKTSEVFYNVANVSFKILLATVAFTAIANPLGLVVTAGLLSALAISTFVLGAISIGLKKSLGKKLKDKEKNLFEPKAKRTLQNKPNLKEGKALEFETGNRIKPIEKVKHVNKKFSSHSLPLSKASDSPTLHTMLPEFQHYVKEHPLSNNEELLKPLGFPAQIELKQPEVQITLLKRQIQDIAREHGLDFAYRPDPDHDQKFTVIRKTEAGMKDIVNVECTKEALLYRFYGLNDVSNRQHDHVLEIRAILHSIKRNNPSQLILAGGLINEVLLIYKTALEIGLNFIQISPATRQKIESDPKSKVELEAIEQAKLPTHPKF